MRETNLIKESQDCKSVGMFHSLSCCPILFFEEHHVQFHRETEAKTKDD